MMFYVDECPIQSAKRKFQGSHSCTYLYTDHGTYHMIQGLTCCKDSFDGVMPPHWFASATDAGTVPCPQGPSGTCRNMTMGWPHYYLADAQSGQPVEIGDYFEPRSGSPLKKKKKKKKKKKGGEAVAKAVAGMGDAGQNGADDAENAAGQGEGEGQRQQQQQQQQQQRQQQEEEESSPTRFLWQFRGPLKVGPQELGIFNSHEDVSRLNCRAACDAGDDPTFRIGSLSDHRWVRAGAPRRLALHPMEVEEQEKQRGGGRVAGGSSSLSAGRRISQAEL